MLRPIRLRVERLRAALAALKNGLEQYDQAKVSAETDWVNVTD
jgi:hypothetical protein